MTDLEEQRVCVKFYFKLGKSFTETFRMLQQAYGEDCLNRRQCHEWYQRFKSGRTSIEDDPKFGRPSTSIGDDHIEEVLAVIRQNRIRVFIERLTAIQALQKFPGFYDTWKFLNFILWLNSTWGKWLYSTTSNIFKIHFKIILKFTPKPTTKSLLFRFSDKKFIPLSHLSHAI